MAKHYFRKTGEKNPDLRSRISELLMNTQANIEDMEERISRFEKRLESILNQLDELESRLVRLEKLLE